MKVFPVLTLIRGSLSTILIHSRELDAFKWMKYTDIIELYK